MDPLLEPVLGDYVADKWPQRLVECIIDAVGRDRMPDGQDDLVEVFEVSAQDFTHSVTQRCFVPSRTSARDWFASPVISAWHLRRAGGASLSWKSQKIVIVV
jgi:hypothetical protein